VIHVYFEYICWKFAGRLLDRVNTLLYTYKAVHVDEVVEFLDTHLVAILQLTARCQCQNRSTLLCNLHDKVTL